jgi:hypothetical protein
VEDIQHSTASNGDKWQTLRIDKFLAAHIIKMYTGPVLISLFPFHGKISIESAKLLHRALGRAIEIAEWAADNDRKAI